MKRRDSNQKGYDDIDHTDFGKLVVVGKMPRPYSKTYPQHKKWVAEKYKEFQPEWDKLFS